jgi:hypothetical protein
MSTLRLLAAGLALFASTTAFADEVRGQCSSEGAERTPAWQCFSCSVDLLYLGSPGYGWWQVSAGAHQHTMSGAKAALIADITDRIAFGYWTTGTSMTPTQCVNAYATCAYDPEFLSFVPPRTYCLHDMAPAIRR